MICSYSWIQTVSSLRSFSSPQQKPQFSLATSPVWPSWLTCLTFMTARSRLSSLLRGSSRRSSARLVTHVSPIFCKRRYGWCPLLSKITGTKGILHCSFLDASYLKMSSLILQEASLRGEPYLLLHLFSCTLHSLIYITRCMTQTWKTNLSYLSLQTFLYGGERRSILS